jgi:hypothetical protein
MVLDFLTDNHQDEIFSVTKTCCTLKLSNKMLITANNALEIANTVWKNVAALQCLEDMCYDGKINIIKMAVCHDFLR